MKIFYLHIDTETSLSRIFSVMSQKQLKTKIKLIKSSFKFFFKYVTTVFFHVNALNSLSIQFEASLVFYLFVYL